MRGRRRLSILFNLLIAECRSFGVILYVLVTGMLPFHADTEAACMQLILRAEFYIPRHVSSSALSLSRSFSSP